MNQKLPSTMRRLLRLLGYTLLGLIVVAALAYTWIHITVERRAARVYAVNVPAIEVPHGDPAAIERGRYLAHEVSMCVECHGEDLGGKMAIESPAIGYIAGSNLTSGRGGLGATYTDEDFVRALVHAVRKDGRSVVFMPAQDYHFKASDVAALIAYIRSVPPVDREMPAPAFGPLGRILLFTGAMPLLPAELIDHERRTFVEEGTPTTPAEAGKYLVDAGACRGCHGLDLTGEGGMPDAANLTPVGIGHYTFADFQRALREGVRPDGSPILPDMPRAFSAMSDEDMRLIFAYLQSLPPKGTKSKHQR